MNPAKPFPRNADGTRTRTYFSTRSEAAIAREGIAEREKEVVLEIGLGTRPKRVGFWGIVPGQVLRTHFWIDVLWSPIRGTTQTIRWESACERWHLGRYDPPHNSRSWTSERDLRVPKEVHDVGTRRHVCHRCAFAVLSEDA